MKNSRMKIVRLMGQSSKAARIFHEWLEKNDIIALPNDREIALTSAGPKALRNCAVFPASIADRIADQFNEWIAAQGEYVTVVNKVRTEKEYRLGLPPSHEKKIKMFIGAGHGIWAFTQNWKTD